MSICTARLAGVLLQLVTFVVLFANPSTAQTGAVSGLSGHVVDTTGATIPGVRVTIARLEAGFERTTTSNLSGDWEARFLQPGTYTLLFELQRFKSLRREGVTVTTGEMALVDGTVLEVGSRGPGYLYHRRANRFHRRQRPDTEREPDEVLSS